MPVYLITRTDNVKYDENAAAVVVVAESEEQALDITREYSAKRGDEPMSVWSAATVNEVDPDGEPGIVLVDFNAG